MVMRPAFEAFLQSLIAEVSITWVIKDVAMSCANKPAQRLGITVLAFATHVAVRAYIYQNIFAIRDKGFIPLPPPADPCILACCGPF